MLNKLLKRCMPWMDKGMWYHVRITANMVKGTLNVTDVKYDSSMFSHYEIEAVASNTSVKIYFSDPIINASIIDFKSIVNSPDNLPQLLLPNDIVLAYNNDDSGYYIEMNPGPGATDLWMFIKRT